MTPFLLLEAVGEINEQYVEEAERYRRKRALSRPLRWVSAAACLAVLAAAGTVWLKTSSGIGTGGSSSAATAEAPPENAVLPESLDAADDAEPKAGGAGPNAVLYTAPSADDAGFAFLPEDYRAVEDAAILTENGLPETAEEMRGDYLGESPGGSLYALAGLEDTPAFAVLEREDGSFAYAAYEGPAESGEALAALYGADSAESLASLSLESGTSRDEAVLEEFYSCFLALESAGAPPESAEGSLLRVGFQNGLVLRMEYLPEEGLLCTGADAYPAGEELAALLDSLEQ